MNKEITETKEQVNTTQDISNETINKEQSNLKQDNDNKNPLKK